MTPEQVEEAHDLIDRWRKLGQAMRGNTERTLAAQFHNPVNANLGDVLTPEELIAARRAAAAAVMNYLHSLHDAADRRLCALRVDMGAERDQGSDGAAA